MSRDYDKVTTTTVINSVLPSASAEDTINLVFTLTLTGAVVSERSFFSLLCEIKLIIYSWCDQ